MDRDNVCVCLMVTVYFVHTVCTFIYTAALLPVAVDLNLSIVTAPGCSHLCVSVSSQLRV